MGSNDRSLLSNGDASARAADRAFQAAARQIAALFERGMSAWNAGDLAGFLDCYERSPRTSYLGAAQIVTGFAAIEAMYAARLMGQGAAALGTLEMSLMDVSLLGAEYAHAIGRFQVTHERTASSEHGTFSAVLRSTALGWRIIADHTSS